MKPLLGRVWARLRASHGYRSWQRYGQARGNLLAGGVAYLGFFSILPALVLGFTVFGVVLRGQPDLFDRVVEYVSSTLPGILQDTTHPDGLLDASRPPTPDVLSVTGAVSLVALLLGGLSWVDALREGVRAMFDQPPLAINPVLGKLRDLFVLCTLGAALLASGVLSFAVSATASLVLGWFQVDGDATPVRLLLRVLGVLVALVADLLLMVVVLRVMSGLSLSRRDVGQGAAVGAVGLGMLKLASGLLLARTADKPLLAGFAVVIGLLVLMNLISRVMLLSAAWAATVAVRRGLLVGAQPPPLPRPAGPRDAVLPSFGPRATDRTTVVAGAVLGVTAAVVARTASQALRTVLGGLPGRPAGRPAGRHVGRHPGGGTGR